jgi:hypothetical protein
LNDADSLFKKIKPAQSIALYQKVATDSLNSATTRKEAYVKLAELNWKFFKDYAKSSSMLNAATKFGGSLFSITALRAKIALESSKLTEGEKWASTALSLAKENQEKKKATLLYAEVVLEQAMQKTVVSIKNKQQLKEGSALLNEILRDQPGNPSASDLLLGTAILLKDGKLLSFALKSYYLIYDEQQINEVLKDGYFLIKKNTAYWKGQKLSISQLSQIAEGLSKIKFFRYADYVATQVKKRKPVYYQNAIQLKNISSYYQYILAVNQINAKLYPQVALGKQDYAKDYDRLMNGALKSLWQKLIIKGKARTFNPDSVYALLHQKFGLEGYTGTTMDYYGMLRGHIIHREIKTIDQYGYRTNFTYISVDRLISRDFTSWYGTTNVGGWGDSTTIVQVRQAYMVDPYRQLSWVTDSTERKNIQTRIKNLKQNDLVNAKKDSLYEPSFLSPMIKFNQASKIFADIDQLNINAYEKNVLFINQITKLAVAASVFAHEGRHAIDQRYFPLAFNEMTNDERELRAKYSEVIFSLNPKMALTGSILGMGNDKTSPHGLANLRFRKTILDWMNKHASEISGIDRKIPLLMQLDLLSDQQILQLCKQADTLIKKK